MYVPVFRSKQQEIQVLKNHYIASEISLRFQSNHINNKINLGLMNYELLNEVEDNLEKTLDLTKYNTDIVISAAAGFITFSGLWLNGDSISNLYNAHPYITFLMGAVLVVLVAVVVTFKSVVIKFGKQQVIKIKRLLGM